MLSRSKIQALRNVMLQRLGAGYEQPFFIQNPQTLALSPVDRETVFFCTVMLGWMLEQTDFPLGLARIFDGWAEEWHKSK